MPTELDLSYAAGVLDGEGYIGILKNGKGLGMQVRAEVCMNCKLIPSWLKDTFGGILFSRQGKYGPLWYWNISGKACKPILEQVRPYMKLKTKQADLAILFDSTISEAGRHMDDKTVLLRLKLAEAMSALNQKRTLTTLTPEIPTTPVEQEVI